MLTLLLCLSLAPPAPPPRPVVVLPLQPVRYADDGDSVVDAAVVARLTARVLASFGNNAALSVSSSPTVCANEACAAVVAGVGTTNRADVVYGTVGARGGLLVVDLHLYEVARGAAVMQARLEAPDRATLEHQIDDVAVRMLGGEPSRTLSPWLVVGGLAGGLGLLAAVAGAGGAGWALWVQNDAAASPSSQQIAASLLVPSLVTFGVGVGVAVAGISVVGVAADE